MYCPSCGKRQPDTAASCAHCGAYLPAPRLSGQESRAASGHVEPEPLAAPSREAFSYAGFWRRAVALLIDSMILTVIGAAVGLALSLQQVTPGVGGAWVDAYGQLLGLVVAWVYYAGLESSSHQATLGKMVFNLRVTDLQGQRISFVRATGRHFGKILSSLLLMIGYLMAAFTDRKQALHDILAGCLVLRAR